MKKLIFSVTASIIIINFMCDSETTYNDPTRIYPSTPTPTNEEPNPTPTPQATPTPSSLDFLLPISEDWTEGESNEKTYSYWYQVDNIDSSKIYIIEYADIDYSIDGETGDVKIDAIYYNAKSGTDYGQYYNPERYYFDNSGMYYIQLVGGGYFYDTGTYRIRIYETTPIPQPLITSVSYNHSACSGYCYSVSVNLKNTIGQPIKSFRIWVTFKNAYGYVEKWDSYGGTGFLGLSDDYVCGGCSDYSTWSDYGWDLASYVIVSVYDYVLWNDTIVEIPSEEEIEYSSN